MSKETPTSVEKNQWCSFCSSCFGLMGDKVKCVWLCAEGVKHLFPWVVGWGDMCFAFVRICKRAIPVSVDGDGPWCCYSYASKLLDLETALLSDVLRHCVLVDHVVHGVGNDVVLGHVPSAFVLAGLTPRV